MKTEEVVKKSRIEVEGLPEPHTCPWLMQYFFVSPLRRLLEPPGKLVGPFVRPGMTSGTGLRFWFRQPGAGAPGGRGGEGHKCGP